VVLILSVLTLMLARLPLLGISLAGLDSEPYTGSLGLSHLGHHAPFSWPVFIALAAAIVACLAPFVVALVRQPAAPARPSFGWPWWGWLGVAAGALCWLLAWTRMPWFEPLQKTTFTPLWLCYIVVVSALTRRRRGTCFLLARPLSLALLFPVSATFWWFFEYLNRFVRSWCYSISDLHTFWDLLWYGFLPFSTVLPAVLCTREWLMTSPRFARSLQQVPLLTPRGSLRLASSKTVAVVVLLGSGCGLAGLGIWPDLLFPLLWLAPLLVILALQVILGETTVLSGLVRGDWRVAGSYALAALICGFFWEMWNSLSLARWSYAIPYVDRFHLFEMPILGYSGYLPFGLECAVVIHLVIGFKDREETLQRLLPVEQG
jgi:hypothetical protein